MPKRDFRTLPDGKDTRRAWVDGYQSALFDLALALAAGGPSRAAEWIVNNSHHAETRQHAAAFAKPGTQMATHPATGAQVDVGPLLLAVDDLAELDATLAYEVGGSLNCGEADALAAVLHYAGHDDAAARWVEGHGIKDEDPAEFETDDKHGHIAAAADAQGLDNDETVRLAREYVATEL